MLSCIEGDRDVDDPACLSRIGVCLIYQLSGQTCGDVVAGKARWAAGG